ncbi:MAG: tetratricopeptide repeat protein [Deltaproteobacteria bacterium]|nr:tetratricopeptide repeat protein [Deltaproteobacteria bacterium]
MVRPRWFAFLVVTGLAGCGGGKSEEGPKMADGPDNLKFPEREVVANPAKISLPAIPELSLPALDPTVHDPRELRVRGKQFLEKDIEVRGYVTWVYDCNAALLALRGAPATAASVQKEIDADPTLCEMPKFHLGATKDAKQVLWVVDVPRPPNKLEREKLPREDLAEWPAVPKFAVGDYVAVSGKFTYTSRRGERNYDGLLQFRALEKSTPTTIADAPPAAALATPPAMKAQEKKPIELEARNASIRNGNDCAQDLERTRIEAALEECHKAIRGWGDNHAAWYLLGLTYFGRKEYTPAQQAFERAVLLAPEDPMYQMMWGVAQFEAVHAIARETEARLTRRSTDQVVADLSKVDLDEALQPLLRAAKADPKLWRAHYYAGRILLAQDRAFDAATHLTSAIRANPAAIAPAVLLVELYRKWDHAEQAVNVAGAVVQNIPSASDAADLNYELAVAYDDASRGSKTAKELEDKAIDAYTKVIDAKRDYHKARFGRGQIYARKKDFTKARADLQAFVSSADSVAYAALKSAAQQQIREMPYR